MANNTIGWGQGATNNNIGWGRGSSNDIGWGSVYENSYVGDTDIIGGDTRFIITVKTDNAGTSLSNQFTLPWIGTYDVEWGDGSSDVGVTGTQTHTYASAGTYDVAVTAASGRIFFNNGGDRQKLLDIKNWGSVAWDSMGFSFAGCNKLTAVSASDLPNLSAVTDGGYMFYNCNQMTSLNVSNWDLSSFTTLIRAFAYCRNLSNLDVTEWNISNVISILSTFEDCDLFDYSLANWDINSITTANSFMLSATGLSTTNYDATLISWAAQTPQNNIVINFGGSKYSTAAAAARTLLTTPVIGGGYGWTITDGGPV